MSLLSIIAIVKAHLLRLGPKQAQFNRCGPPFLPLHTLPTEIILQITDYLDGSSLLNLCHTNQDLFYVTSLNPHYATPISEARYLKVFLTLTDEFNESRLGFCTSCQQPRPLTSFSVSEAVALERSKQANCLRHSQLWMCPHVSYKYESIAELRRQGQGFVGIDSFCGFPNCGSLKCTHDFHHKFLSSPLLEYYIQSTIFIDAVRYRSGPGTLHDKFQRSFPRARLVKAMDNLRAPIDDHHMLSDEQVRNRYDPTDIDWYDNDVIPPLPRHRIIRKSDGFCSSCHARGVQTEFYFAISTGQSDYRANKGLDSDYFLVQVVLLRSLGAYPAKPEKPNEHWRCHGVTQEKLAQFRDTWSPGQGFFPYLFDD